MPFLNRIFGILLIALLLCGTMAQTSARAATPEELVAACDTQASDPHDPDAHAKPVKDDEMAFGAAIDACQAAVTAKPDFARGWYELGRAQHLARHDSAAFEAYAHAASQSYGPGLRAIGEAFASGRGLPPGRSQDPKAAQDYFEKAIAVGDNFAQDSLDNVKHALAASVFNPDIFQNPDYMGALYNRTLLRTSNPAYPRFLAYLHGAANALGGDTVLFIDQGCQQLISQSMLTSIEIDLQASISRHMTQEGILNNATSGIQMDSNAGERDAKSLMHTYTCSNPIVQRVAATIAKAGAKTPTIERYADSLPGPMGQFVKTITQLPALVAQSHPVAEVWRWEVTLRSPRPRRGMLLP